MQSGIAALPGVQSVGMGSVIPTRAAGFMLEVNAEGRTLASGEAHPQAEYRSARTRLLQDCRHHGHEGPRVQLHGRADDAGSRRPEQGARRSSLPGVDPLGRRIAWSGEVLKFIGIKENDGARWLASSRTRRTADSTRRSSLPSSRPSRRESSERRFRDSRERRHAASLAPAATNVIRSIAPEQRIEHVLTGEQLRDESIAPRRLNALLVGSFSILALIVAAIGIAAVLAFSVTARTNEIGIRMSLGADAGSVQRMVLSEGGALCRSASAWASLVRCCWRA